METDGDSDRPALTSAGTGRVQQRQVGGMSGIRYIWLLTRVLIAIR